MSESLTRKKLYDLVWSKPMIEIAKEYGFSDRGLAKLCERNSISVPPRGYWAKKYAGVKVPKAPLLLLEKERAETIVLLERAKIATKKDGSTEDSIETLPDEIRQAIDRERKPENQIKVPAALQNPHAIVVKWIQKAEKEERDSKNSRFSWREPITPLDRRMWKLSSYLFKELEKRGFMVSETHNPQELCISYENDKISYQIYEKIRQYRRLLTEQEKKEIPYSQKWRQEREKTGKLEITLTPESDSYSKVRFQEENSLFETTMNEIVVKVIEVIWVAKRARIKREEESHRRWEEEKRQRAIREEADKEDARKLNLEHKAYAWKQAQIIREYIAALDTALSSDKLKLAAEEYTNFKNWALGHADDIDFIANGNPFVDLKGDPEKLIPASSRYVTNKAIADNGSWYPGKKWY